MPESTSLCALFLSAARCSPTFGSSALATISEMPHWFNLCTHIRSLSFFSCSSVTVERRWRGCVDVSLEGQVELGWAESSWWGVCCLRGWGGGEVYVVHGSWCRLGSRQYPGRGGNWIEIGHPAGGKEDRSLGSVGCSGYRLEWGAEHQASSVPPGGAADFWDMYHGACPRQQWRALRAGECVASASSPQSEASPESKLWLWTVRAGGSDYPPSYLQSLVSSLVLHRHSGTFTWMNRERWGEAGRKGGPTAGLDDELRAPGQCQPISIQGQATGARPLHPQMVVGSHSWENSLFWSPLILLGQRD